jgi:hypothetical protein
MDKKAGKLNILFAGNRYNKDVTAACRLLTQIRLLDPGVTQYFQTGPGQHDGTRL